jgi:hypothetical protein
MAMKKFFFPYNSFIIEDGSEHRFWEDKWLGNATLREQYQLYTILFVTSVILSLSCWSLPHQMQRLNEISSIIGWHYGMLVQRLALVQMMLGAAKF